MNMQVNDIREIQKLKARLEQEIAGKLLQFMLDTNTEVKQVTIVKQASLDKPFTYEVKLEVTL